MGGWPLPALDATSTRPARQTATATRVGRSSTVLLIRAPTTAVTAMDPPRIACTAKTGSTRSAATAQSQAIRSTPRPAM